MTTRGFGAAEAEQVANLIADVLESPNDDTALGRVKRQVEALCKRLPVYPRASAAGESGHPCLRCRHDEMPVLQG